MYNMSKCIEWTGFLTDDKGYPFTNNKQRLHRQIYEKHNGPIPKGLMVRHLCHNKRCINPAHLAVGTAKDNMEDNRTHPDFPWGFCGKKGELNGRNKITEQDAKRIKYGNEKRGVLAKELNVTVYTIDNIRNGNRWKHI